MSVEIREIRRAHLLGQEGEFTVRLDRGRIAWVHPSDSAPGGPRGAMAGARKNAALGRREIGVIDAAGGLVMSSFVDPHLHLDLAFSLNLVEPNQSGTLLEAIRLWSAAKAKLSPQDVRERAVRAIRAEVGFGTGLIRSHVDVAASAGLRLVEGVLAAREAARALCTIQLVAFPQDGLLRDKGAFENMEAALRSGVDVVGGIPHIERTRREGVEHLRRIFDLAEKHDRDIDVHIDETDDPHSLYTEELASLTIRRGRQGRVTASHVCALSSYPDVHASRVMDLLAEARIGVVTNPGVNLHLQGRFDRYPKRRGLTRVSELLARGVRCAAGQDCICDPFYPLGTGQMLDQAFLLAHADHMSTPSQMQTALGMIGEMAADVIAMSDHVLSEGGLANLVVFGRAYDTNELIRARPRPRYVIHAGSMALSVD